MSLISGNDIKFLQRLEQFTRDEIDVLIEKRYPNETEIEYMFEDYAFDCLGFFQRNPLMLADVIDDYNFIITDKYFLNKLGEPPLVEYAKITVILGRMNEPMNSCIYDINRDRQFRFLGWSFDSELIYKGISIRNAKLHILTQLWDRCWTDMRDRIFAK